MKKVILLFSVFSLFCSYGQITKGSILLSASDLKFKLENRSLDRTYQNQNYLTTDKTYYISYAPTIGYFVIDNLSFGIKADFNKLVIKSDEKFSESTRSLGTFVRYYYPLNNILPFVQLERTAGKTTYTTWQEGDTHMVIGEGTNYVNTLSGSLGASLRLGKTVFFDLLMVYTYYIGVEKDGWEKKSTTDSINLNFGFTIIFGKAKK